MVKLSKSILTALSGVLLLGSQEALSAEGEVSGQGQGPTYTYEGNHMYKENKIPDQLFDSTMDCGLNLPLIIHRYYIEGEKYYPLEYGKLPRVDSFENDVKNYGFAKHELKKADKYDKYNSERNLDRLEQSLKTAGLTEGQIKKIPAIKGKDADLTEFKCKKISGKK